MFIVVGILSILFRFSWFDLIDCQFSNALASGILHVSRTVSKTYR